jgi:hypothetical protein
MKLLALLVLTFASSLAFAAEFKKLVCTDDTSKLTLEKSTFIDEFEGAYEYNKNHKGEYGSIMMLACNTVSLDESWDLLDCMETTYGITGPAYQVPKNLFAAPPQSDFTIIALSRDENDGAIDSSERFEKCSLE